MSRAKKTGHFNLLTTWHDSASMPPHKNDEGAARVPHKVTTSMLPPHEEKISLLSELV
jgi:hypothetical protein